MDKDFDWKSFLNINQHQSISDWFLSYDDVTEFDYVEQKTIAKNAFQDFLFKQITIASIVKTKRKRRRLIEKETNQSKIKTHRKNTKIRSINNKHKRKCDINIQQQSNKRKTTDVKTVNDDS